MGAVTMGAITRPFLDGEQSLFFRAKCFHRGAAILDYLAREVWGEYKQLSVGAGTGSHQDRANPPMVLSSRIFAFRRKFGFHLCQLRFQGFHSFFQRQNPTAATKCNTNNSTTGVQFTVLTITSETQ